MQIIQVIYLIVLVSGFSQHVKCKSNLRAIVMSTSKFWFNYRQGANSYALYTQLKKNEVLDENILHLSPENLAANPRNNDPGIISFKDGQSTPYLNQNANVDYRHTDVSVTNFLNQLRGRYPENLPQVKRLQLDENSRFLIYLNGHGGDGYLKMQDTHVILTYNFGKALRELYYKKQYKSILAISDSCEAVSLFYKIDIPNVMYIGSSKVGERSISHGSDNLIGMSKSDKFTFITYDYLETHLSKSSKKTIYDMMTIYTRDFLTVDFEYKESFEEKDKKKKEKELLLSNFFADYQDKKFNYLKYADLEIESDTQLDRKRQLNILNKLLNTQDVDEQDFNLKIENKSTLQQNELNTVLYNFQ